MTSPRSLLMVDTGFLIQALITFTGHQHRDEVTIDYVGMSQALAEVAEEATSTSLLRQVWYDAAWDAKPRAEHRALAEVPGVQVSLGWLRGHSGARPQQKGVDSLIVRDLIRAALRGTASTIVLIAGDGDLVPGVQEAADYGIEIVLWGVAPEDPQTAQSAELIALADRRRSLELPDFSGYIRAREQASSDSSAETTTDHGADDPRPVADRHVAPAPSPRAETVRVAPPTLSRLSTQQQWDDDARADAGTSFTASDAGRMYGQRWAERVDPDARARFRDAYRRPVVPRSIDIDLRRFGQHRGVDLDEDAQRRDLRGGFWDAIEQR